MTTFIKVPFFEQLRNAPLEKGKSIVIDGFVMVSPKSFKVELICGHDKDQSDIAAMFEFIFKDDTAENLTICKSRDKGQWIEPIDITENFPFAAGKKFELKIYDMEDQLRISVNSKRYFDFLRRTDPTRISHIFIDGSVELNSVKFN